MVAYFQIEVLTFWRDGKTQPRTLCREAFPLRFYCFLINTVFELFDFFQLALWWNVDFCAFNFVSWAFNNEMANGVQYQKHQIVTSQKGWGRVFHAHAVAPFTAFVSRINIVTVRLMLLELTNRLKETSIKFLVNSLILSVLRTNTWH